MKPRPHHYISTLVLVAVVLAVSHLCFAGEAVKVGLVFPLSGGSANQGVMYKAGFEIAAEEINAEGGIKSLGGAKVQLVIGDSKSTPDGGAAETERLATLEKVSVILGAYNSAVTFPATQIAERYKTPWIVTGAVKDEITERGFKYTFRDYNKASFDVKEVIDALELLNKETGQKPKTAALVYEGTDWGRSTAEFARKLFPPAGIKIVLEESYPPSTPDFTPQMLKIKALKPDMMLVAAYTPDHLLISKQVLEQKINFLYGFWTMGGGADDPAFYKALPQAAVSYMLHQEDWDITAVNKPWYPSLESRAKAKLGLEPGSHVVFGYSLLYLVKDALERAGSADREKVREALANTDITEQNCASIQRSVGSTKYCPALLRGIQRIKFDEQGQNTFSHGLISQNLKGVRTPIAPLGNRVAPPVWPIPGWDKR